MDSLRFQDTGSAATRSAEAPAPLPPPARPSRPRRGVLALAALVAAGAVALVATQFTGAHGDQRAEVRQVVKTYETAIMSGDGATACAQLTADAVRQLLQTTAGVGQGNTCADVGRSMRRYVDALISNAPSPEKAAEARRMIQDPPVEVLSIDGDHATVTIAGVSGRPFPLVRRDGGWKISGFSLP
jgi:hypothetical protein